MHYNRVAKISITQNFECVNVDIWFSLGRENFWVYVFVRVDLYSCSAEVYCISGKRISEIEIDRLGILHDQVITFFNRKALYSSPFTFRDRVSLIL